MWERDPSEWGTGVARAALRHRGARRLPRPVPRRAPRAVRRAPRARPEARPRRRARGADRHAPASTPTRSPRCASGATAQDAGRRAHRAGRASDAVFGVPTFFEGDEAVFVRFMDRGPPTTSSACSTCSSGPASTSSSAPACPLNVGGRRTALGPWLQQDPAYHLDPFGPARVESSAGAGTRTAGRARTGAATARRRPAPPARWSVDAGRASSSRSTKARQASTRRRHVGHAETVAASRSLVAANSDRGLGRIEHDLISAFVEDDQHHEVGYSVRTAVDHGEARCRQ